MSNPNPGSDAALLQGCTCPVLDNGHGRVPPMRTADGKDAWWMHADCPLHGQQEEEE